MHSVFRKRVVKAAGSAMDVFPITDYSEYVQHGSDNQRIFGYWQRAGRYIEKAVTIYNVNEKSRKSANL